MRIVWVSPRHPSRDEGSNFEVERGMLSQVAARHEVHVVSASLPPGEVTLPIGAHSVTAEGVNWWSHYPRSVVSWALRAAVPGPPMDVRATRTRTRGLAEVVRRRLERGPADLVLVTMTELAAAGCVGSVPMALLLPRGLTARCQDRAAGPVGGLRRLRWWVDARRAARWERRWGRRAAGVACARPHDLRVLRRVVGGDVVSVSPDDPGALDQWLETLAPKHQGLSGERRVEGAGIPVGPLSRPAATVVVCTREREQLLERSLSSIATAAEGEPGTELLVVEQGRPMAADICAALGIDATVVHDDGAGAARARNRGARRATGSAVLFTDDDCSVPPGWVVDHVSALARPGVVASLGVVEGLSRFGGQGPDPVAWPARHHAGSPPWAIGHSSNMAVRRDALFQARGFDERFGPGAPGGVICEDADLIVRLLRGGGAIQSGVGSPVLHLEWRTPGEERGNLRAYERGAGAWIGKLLREDRRAAVPYLLERIELTRDRVRNSVDRGRTPIPVLISFGAFVHGLLFGLRLSPWPPTSQPATTD